MKKETDPVRKQLNNLLAEIGAKKNAIAVMGKCRAAAIERAAAQFDPEIARAEEDLKAIEAELIGIARYNKAQLFTDTERVDLKNGAVLRTIQKRVVKVKTMLASLKAAGLRHLIKVAEAPDWDSIDQFTDSELESLGARRKKKEIFAYEIKGAR
jgi:hypothetical protein